MSDMMIVFISILFSFSVNFLSESVLSITKFGDLSLMKRPDLSLSLVEKLSLTNLDDTLSVE